MGNLTSYEVNLDEFNIEDPTPLDANQKMALDRGRDTGRLDFSLHSLTDIPIQVFDLSSTLTILNLSVNKLKFLPASLWEMTMLESLDISSNELESLPPQVEQLTNLQVLNLRHNFLTTLPASLGRCVALQKLNLEYNRLKTLPSLEALTDLRDLRLKYNQIAQLPPSLGAIKGCLDLQNNYLVEPPVCDSLTELLLENNSIAALPRNVDALAAVTRLTIANNRIKRLPAQIQHLKVLTELGTPSISSPLPAHLSRCRAVSTNSH
jgi:Leucine-rich repeat (LRR) protein